MKDVLISINGKHAINPNTTHGGLAKICAENSNAKFVHSIGNNYDFKKNLVRTMKYDSGKFVDLGYEVPKADLWIFYADGYQNNMKELGFETPLKYHAALMDFLDEQIELGNVGEIISSPDSERKTLKKYFAELNTEEFNVIPTYVFDNFDDLYENFKEKKRLVVKPDWGGAMTGVQLLEFDKDLSQFIGKDLSGLVFQDYHPGVEKRMWLADGKFVEGRIIKDRDTPWQTHDSNSFVSYYNQEVVESGKIGISKEEFFRDLHYVNKIAKETGLKIGSVDFLGGKINELNGAGTGYTASDRLETVNIDARQHLFNYVRSLLNDAKRKE